MDAVVEQCFRDVLAAFGLGGLVPPRVEPRVSGYCCSQFAASSEAIRRHPRRAYEAAYRMLGLDAPCHPGALDWAVLHAPRSHQRDSPRLNRHTAGAWEHLNHARGRATRPFRAGGARRSQPRPAARRSSSAGSRSWVRSGPARRTRAPATSTGGAATATN